MRVDSNKSVMRWSGPRSLSELDEEYSDRITERLYLSLSNEDLEVYFFNNGFLTVMNFISQTNFRLFGMFDLRVDGLHLLERAKDYQQMWVMGVTDQRNIGKSNLGFMSSSRYSDPVYNDLVSEGRINMYLKSLRSMLMERYSLDIPIESSSYRDPDESEAYNKVLIENERIRRMENEDYGETPRSWLEDL